MWKFLIILLHLTNSFTTADRRHIMIDIDRESWLSDQDFEMMIRYSYPFATCCNTLVDGRTEEITTLFNQFIKIYKNGYTIGRIRDECRGYFLLGSTGETLAEVIKGVPTALPTTEILIIVDADLQDDSPLLNVTLFDHSNVNIVSRSGNWTLTENFLQPRVFKKVFRYSEMGHKSGIVDLEGRQLQVATAKNLPPFCYLSTTVNKTVNGVEAEFFVANDENELDGVEVKLFLIMAEYLNFTWMIRKPPGEEMYGWPKHGKWNGGMIGQLMKKEVDLAFGEIWLEKHKAKHVNLSVPWHHIWISFVVPRPKPIESIWALARPFTLDVWITVVIIVVFESFAIWGKARINPRVSPRFRSFMNTVTELLGRFLGCSAPRQTHGIQGRLQLWHFAGLLVVTFYSSSLAARLTTPDYEPRVDTIQQFAESNLTCILPTPQPPNYKHIFSKADPYAEELVKHCVPEADQWDEQQRMLKENVAVIGKISHSIFFPETNVTSADLANHRLMRQSLAEYYVSFAAQPWLVHSIDAMMLRLSESGLVEYHLRDVLHRRVNGSLSEVFDERDGENEDDPKPLKLEPLGAGFIILLTGHLIATIILYLEWRNKKRERSSKFRSIN